MLFLMTIYPCWANWRAISILSLFLRNRGDAYNAIDAKSRAKDILSLNIWDLGDNIGFKRPFMMIFDPILGNLSF